MYRQRCIKDFSSFRARNIILQGYKCDAGPADLFGETGEMGLVGPRACKVTVETPTLMLKQ